MSLPVPTSRRDHCIMGSWYFQAPVRYLRIVGHFFLRIAALPSIFLEFPVSVVQWANLSSLQPAGDAVEVESVL